MKFKYITTTLKGYLKTEPKIIWEKENKKGIKCLLSNSTSNNNEQEELISLTAFDEKADYVLNNFHKGDFVSIFGRVNS